MIAFFVNQMPFKTHVHDKEFLDHFAQLKHYVNTKYLVCDIHSTFLGTYNKDCKFTCISFITSHDLFPSLVKGQK